MAKSKESSTKKTSTAKTASSKSKPAETTKARGGIAQQVTPSAELGAIVGKEPLTRAELTKRVWDYIKSHNLQDANDRRQINADDTLKKVLGKDQVSMFEMTKLINQHVK
ncbi:MAG TPA: SWIB/MDM2 domain-containing protein [Candidatus Competibacteraceae bacterium]|nr:SWIB/MDM2 domain-containing protein [Candidatus Competibacteraceae bacterium]